MDVIGTCSKASENESSQTLAVVLSIVFVVYIGVAVLLSAFQIYTVSSQSEKPARSERASTAPGVGSSAELVPLLSVG